MSIRLCGDAILVVRLSLSLQEFPALLARHRVSDPSTDEVERLAAKYVADGFPARLTKEFVTRVCHWGNYDGIRGKVFLHNSLDCVRHAFRKGYDELQAGNPAQAIREVTEIHGLGISFASKHLKFLDPKRAVVLDSIISGRLGYPLSPAGYAELVEDCATIREMLNSRKVVPLSGPKTWRISDVEMAIFKYLFP